ncbi:MAG: SAM-dependent methyltransferase, partial [Actinomycetota bacterium]
HMVITAFYKDFDELWTAFENGVGPSGAYVTSLESPQREALKSEFNRQLGSPEGFFELDAKAWWVAGSK